MTLFEQTVDEACKKSRQEGMQKGIRKGLREGRQEGVQEVVLNMLKKSANMAFIAEVTGLPVEEIKKLKNGS